jgi:curved DNA-binding protein CbpA
LRGKDPQGYYAALNIGPDASAAEIRLAYEFLKQSYHTERKHLDIGKIRAAYKVLSDPKERRSYDAGDANRRAAKGELLRQLKAHALPIAIALLAVSAAVLLYLVGPDVRAQFVGFDSGDELYWADGSRDLGTVEAFVQQHTFPSGAVAPAYLVRPAGGGEPIWYPARDLKRYARQR